MRVIQILGWILLLFTLMFGVYEIVQHLRVGSRSLTGVAEFWFHLQPNGFNRVNGYMMGTVGRPWLWLVHLPVLFVSGVLALLCLFATYARRDPASVR
ncbi:MAG TPA: hypothetical protein VJ890_01215 [Vineibacter sp.]|nr:hypothetical protein [Vineibacter sp.]